jgi:hypothetical protein
VGFVVDRIVDVVASPVELHAYTTSRGILGTTVIQERVTDVLDVDGALQLALQPQAL